MSQAQHKNQLSLCLYYKYTHMYMAKSFQLIENRNAFQQLLLRQLDIHVEKKNCSIDHTL